MISLEALAQFLDHFFAVHRFDDDQGGVYRASPQPIRRLGLALEPWPQIARWVHNEHLDALFLHRPWQLQPQQLKQIGVLAYHLAFDEGLTVGFNPRLAAVLELSAIEVLGKKSGRPIGMVGQVPTQSFHCYCSHVNEVFGGLDQADTCAGGEVSRVAVVGAMTEALVREATERGAAVYVTGQFRQPAKQAVLETGMGVIVVGHRRSEEWGLRALAGVLQERWSGLEVVLPNRP